MKFLFDYLRKRQRCVVNVIGGQKSDYRPVASGVPQGSILGPLHFVMFIEDIISCISKETKIALYADNTKIWREIIDWDDYLARQHDINSLFH